MPPSLRVSAALALLIATAACRAGRVPPRGPAPEIQLSLSGFQSPIDPQRADALDRTYTLASDATLDYFRDKGIRTFRLPMLWERMQPHVGGPLDPVRLAELDAFMDRADAAGVRIIPDLHAFARRGDAVLGTPALPTSALVSFWTQFARHYRGRMAGYDIMNEPHDMPTRTVWPDAAQLTVDAIRKVDRATPILVEGDDWSSAARWPQSNGALDIRDPAGRIVYSAHLYLDADTSGQYRKAFADDGAAPAVGPDRLRPFVGWLRDHHRRGHLGEFGVPYADPRWLPVLDALLAEVRADGDVLTGATYWMAGDWADQYPLTLQPAKGGWVDRPQLETLTRRR